MQTEDKHSILVEMFSNLSHDNVLVILGIIKEQLTNHLCLSQKIIQDEFDTQMSFFSHCHHQLTDAGCCGCNQISPGNQVCREHVCNLGNFHHPLSIYRRFCCSK